MIPGDVHEVTVTLTNVSDRTLSARTHALSSGRCRVPDGADWNEALVSCNPDFEVIPVRLMLWVIAIAQERLDR